MIYGRGAGAKPTASAIISDVMYALGHDKPVYPTFENESADLSSQLSLAKDRCCAFYVRLSAKDAPGVLSHVTGCLSRTGINVRAIFQPERRAADGAQITLLTHPAFEKDMRQAVSDFDPTYVTVMNVIRVEE